MLAPINHVDGLLKEDDFTTCCLEFFNMDIEVDEVVVVRRTGKKVSRKNIKKHTTKEIRKAHDIRKMLVAGSFNWL